MGYFKRKRTNKKKGKRGTKRYRGGATNATNGSQSMSPTNQPPNAPTSVPPELEEKMTILKKDIDTFIIEHPGGKELINNRMNEIMSI